MNTVLLIILGLIFGSFVNAWVWRLRKQETARIPSTKERRELSVLHGRSMCVHCKHTLAWNDLVPVISWLTLKGRCRYCSKSISWQYPLVEGITAGLFILSYVGWPVMLQGLIPSLQFGIWLIFVICFMALAVYDLRWMLLPDKIVLPLIGLAVFYQLLGMINSGDPLNVIINMLGGFLAIGGLFYLLFWISDGRWIGGGDVKLAFVIGILLGSPSLSMLVIFTASLLGTFAALPWLLNGKKRMQSQIPFGPFLLMATFLVQLYGERIIKWYVDSLLLM